MNWTAFATTATSLAALVCILKLDSKKLTSGQWSWPLVLLAAYFPVSYCLLVGQALFGIFGPNLFLWKSFLVQSALLAAWVLLAHLEA